MAQRFSLRYPMAGLMNLDVKVRALRLLPALNQLSAEMKVEAAGPALNRSNQVTLEVEFALRLASLGRMITTNAEKPKNSAAPAAL